MKPKKAGLVKWKDPIKCILISFSVLLTKKFQLRMVGYSYVRTIPPLPEPTCSWSVPGWWGGMWCTQRAADLRGGKGQAQQCLSETPGTGAPSLPCDMRRPPSSLFYPKELVLMPETAHKDILPSVHKHYLNLASLPLRPH